MTMKSHLSKNFPGWPFVKKWFWYNIAEPGSYLPENDWPEACPALGTDMWICPISQRVLLPQACVPAPV